MRVQLHLPLAFSGSYPLQLGRLEQCEPVKLLAQGNTATGVASHTAGSTGAMLNYNITDIDNVCFIQSIQSCTVYIGLTCSDSYRILQWINNPKE